MRNSARPLRFGGPDDDVACEPVHITQSEYRSSRRPGDRFRSYAASGIINVASFEAKVGQAVAPYTATDFRTNETIGQSQQYSHTFTAAADDTQAGVSFTASSSSAGTAVVCVGNVAVRTIQ
jgi:hypothetical protein